LTGSEFAAAILRDWIEMVHRFVKVIPSDYRIAMERIKQKQTKESEVVDMTEEVFA
jgi:glutamate synthase (NADPH) large chain